MNKIIIKNTGLAILLVVLIAGIFVVRNRSPFGNKQTSFSIGKEKDITRIELSQNESNLVLGRSDKSWKVNGVQEARNSAISFILNVLTEMEIKSPVSPELFAEQISERNIIPVKVKVFEGRRLIRSFYVFKTASNAYGNIMKLRPGAKPYIVNVPGLEEDIGSIFNPDELFWKPFIVFNLLPSEISSVTFDDCTDPQASFKIDNIAGQVKLSGGDSELSGWDSSRVRRYLSYFVMVPFEGWANDLGMDEALRIQARPPLYRIKVTKVNGNELLLTLWEKLTVADGKSDSDRLWARTGERKEFFIIRYFDIDPLLKKRSYFFKE